MEPKKEPKNEASRTSVRRTMMDLLHECEHFLGAILFSLLLY